MGNQGDRRDVFRCGLEEVASDGQSLQERRANARPLQTHRAELAGG